MKYLYENSDDDAYREGLKRYYEYLETSNIDPEIEIPSSNDIEFWLYKLSNSFNLDSSELENKLDFPRQL
ncbi:MAG: hypothetical protein R3A13_06700 [Bdellovibrionota bacterium]